MKYVKAIVLATAAVLLTGVLAGLLSQPARAEVSFEFSYSTLSQHGSWLVSGQYGRVWQPREYNRGWNPYYDGHWVDTDMGWSWVSDYEWGSIPYHYGTWISDPRYGWVWIPGEIWAPSWVVFRTSPEYIGWAPVPPGFSVGVSIELGGPSSFIYVSSRDFLAPRLRGSIIPIERTSVFMNNTTVVNNIVIENNVVINRGPDVQSIERATGRTIRPERIENVARVAPFDHVSRARLAVAPERAKRGLRVAEPVPESRPLPVSDKHAAPDNRNQGKAPTRAPAPESAPVTKSRQPDPRPQGRPTRAAPHEKAQAQQGTSPQAPAEAKNKANEQQKAKGKADAQAQQAQAEQSVKAQPAAKAKADAKAKKDNADRKKDAADKSKTPDPR